MNRKNEEPKLIHTIISDFKQGGFFHKISRDFKELKDFYLSDEQKSRLANMSWLKRWFFLVIWLLKIFILKLTPARRILLLVGIILVLISDTVQYSHGQVEARTQTDVLGCLIILFVLMLELKDKLLAKNELAAGRSVQLALMPITSPKVPGWQLWLFTRPANDVGGDLVDFIELSQDRFGIALGDVTGKGLGAALFMAKIQATIRALAQDFPSLAELGAKLNQIFYRDSLQSSFASLIYLELQANSGVARLLNAGHMPPILVRADKIEEMPKGAPALGILPMTVYAEQQADLKMNDILFIYSDGLTEACNEKRDFFGEARLYELFSHCCELSAQEMGEKIIASIDQFKGEAGTFDDISIVILKRVND